MKMIDAKELRIGNLVKYKSHNFCYVDAICDYPNEIYKKVSIKGEHLGAELPFVDIEPIPLTTQILEKCGFNLQPQKMSIYVNGRIKLWLGSNGVIAYLMHEDKNESFWISNPVQNLHQLQNLYYCLTGTELSIKI